MRRKDEDNIILAKSFQFAIRCVNLYKYLCESKHEYVLSKQMLKSGTSIGANIKEGIQGQSKPDFISKLSISLKEAGETEYWLELLYATEFINAQEYESINADCVELIKILTSILKTSRSN